MKRQVGEEYTFSNGTFLLQEDHILQDQDKLPFMKKLLVSSIGFIAVGVFITTMIFTFMDAITFNLWDILIYGVSFFLYIVVHELLHGIVFVIGSENKWNTMTFGLELKSGVAYCISLVPVTIRRARLSLMMPLYVVCIPLYIFSFITTDYSIAILAILLASGSVGDIYYLWKLRHNDASDYMFEELPTDTGYEIGYYLFKKV